MPRLFQFHGCACCSAEDRFPRVFGLTKSYEEALKYYHFVQFSPNIGMILVHVICRSHYNDTELPTNIQL